MFELGQVVCTTNFKNTVGVDRFAAVASRMLGLHSGGDWGDVSTEDKKSNDEAVKTGERILSAYHTEDNIKVWVLTERDRSVTTILLPEDY